jgi:hypothetical protein
MPELLDEMPPLAYTRSRVRRPVCYDKYRRN